MKSCYVPSCDRFPLGVNARLPPVIGSHLEYVGNMFNHSFYHMQIHMKRIPFLDVPDDNPAVNNCTCKDVMSEPVECFHQRPSSAPLVSWNGQ
eukprot:1179850-Prorocentrum_minimum.AAC.2